MADKTRYTANLVSDDNIYVDITNDRVGIGTTVPTSKLDVRGDGRFTGVVTASSFSGNASSSTYSTSAGIATYATSAGIATYATTAGVSIALQNARNFSITGNFVTATAISFDGTGNVALAATIPLDAIGLGTYTTGDYVKNISGTSNQITVTGGTGEGSTPTLSIPSQFTAPQDLTVTRDVQINRNLNVTGNITIGGTTAFINVQQLQVYDQDLVLGFRTDGSGNDISNDNTANHGGIAIASTEGNPLVSLYNPGIGESTLPTYKKIMWFKSNSFTGLNTDAWLINYAVGIGSTQFPSGTRLAAGSVQFTERDLAVVRGINASGIITGTLANTLTLNTSGTGLSGSTTYNNSGVSTFTVTSNATSANTASTIVARDASGNFSAGTITANLTGNASSATYATSAGVSTNVIGGIGSLTQLQVTGISTFSSNIIQTSGSVGLGTTNPLQRLQIGTANTLGINTTGTVFVVTSNADVGIGTTNPTSKLHIIGNALVTGVVTATSFSGNASSATYATTAGIATYATSAGIATYATNAGIATYATSAGIATYATTAGIATYATNAGIATYATTAGIATYATSAGIATYATSAGIATYATSAGVSTNVIGGIGSLTQLQVTGISTFSSNIIQTSGSVGLGTTNPLQRLQIGTANTLGINTTGTVFVVTSNADVGIGTTNPTSKLHIIGNALVTGVVTATSFSGNASSATYATTAGIATYATSSGVSTSVIGGIGSITQLQVTGVSTFTNGPVFIGTATSTGTTNQRLQVVGGASFTGTNYNIGIGTTNPLYTFTVTDTGTPATSGLTNCLADFTTTANSYGQINLRNTSTGTNASSDIIVTADNGSDTTNFIDLGINNSGFSVGSWTINGANDGYLYTSDGNLSIGAINASVAKYISFFTGGTLISNERMRINATGVGIGTANPNYALEVRGDIGATTLVVSGASTFSNGPVLVGSGTSTGTASQTLQVTGGAYVSGNLGIGTTNPSSALDVRGAINVGAALSITAQTGLYYNPIYFNKSSGSKRLSIGINTDLDYGSSGTRPELFFVGEDNTITAGTYPKIKITNPNYANSDFYSLKAAYTGSGIGAYPAYGYIRNELYDATYSIALNNSFAFSVGDRGSTSGSRESNFSSGNEAFVVLLDGSTSLFYSKSKKFETSGVGVTVYGNLNVGTGGTVITTTAFGLVGIGTTNPSQPLHVQGNARVTGAVYDSTNSPGTSGQVLQSTVTGTQWTTAAAGGGSGKFDTSIDNVLYIQPTGTLDIVGVGTTTTQITTLPSGSNKYLIHSIHVTNISNGDAEITAGFILNNRKVPASISVSAGSSGGSGIHTFSVGSASSITVGMAVTGTGNIGETTGIGSTAGFQFNTYVTSVDGTNITLSKPMSGRATGTLFFSPVSDVVSRLPVPVGSAVELLKQPMVLNALDSIVLQSTGAGSGIGSTSTSQLHQTANVGFLTVTAGAAITNFLTSGMLVQGTGNNTGIQTNTFVGVGYTPGSLSIPLTRPATTSLASTSYSFTEVVVPQDGALQATIVYQSSTDTSYQNGTGTVVGIVTLASQATSPVLGITSTVPLCYYGTGNTYPSIVQSIRVSNISDSSIYPGGDYPVWVGIGNSDTVFSWLAYNMIIPKNSSIELCESPKRIGIGQSIFAYASTPGTIEIQVAAKQKTT